MTDDGGEALVARLRRMRTDAIKSRHEASALLARSLREQTAAQVRSQKAFARSAVLLGGRGTSPLPGGSADHRHMFDALPGPAAVVGRDGRVRDANLAWRQAMGRCPEIAAVGDEYAGAWESVIGKDSVLRDAIRAIFAGDIDHFQIDETLPGNSDERTLLVQLQPLAVDPVTEILAVHIDISAQRKREKQYAYKATHDPLTGAANRTLLFDRLDESISRARRYGESFGVLYLDLDGFKHVNDKYGHAVGDEVLVATATRLQSLVRSADLFARVGGDEFVILVAHVDDLQPVAELAERLVRALDEPIETSVGQLPISVSIGISLPRHAADADEVIAEADAAMYRAKQAGLPSGVTMRASEGPAYAEQRAQPSDSA